MRNFVPILLVVWLTGCDSKRIAELEKENKELKAKLDAVPKVVPLELQEKCSRQATLYFIREGYEKRRQSARAGDMVFLTSHYNDQTGRCFGEITQHTFIPSGPILHQRILFDAYEGKIYGLIASEATMKEPTALKFSTCSVTDLTGGQNNCATTKEYNELVKKLFGM